MPDWCVTFGTGHSDPPGLLKTSFWRVTAPDESAARALVAERIGRRWAFIYPAEEFEPQIAEYGMTEVWL